MRNRVLLAAVAAVALGLSIAPLTASASSHREAPLIAEDPLADNTDLYTFQAPDNPNNVVLVANYIPFENPAGGPNFYRFGDDVQYQIHVDNVGDGRSHVTFTFRFHTSTVDPTTFLYNTPYVSGGALTKRIAFDGTKYLGWNRPQTYSVSVSRLSEDDSSSVVLGRNLLTPPDVVGTSSTGDAAYYHSLANAAIHNLNGGIRVWAGQRDDPFYANLGPIFDILSLNPLSATGGQDYLNNLNVHSIVLSVPKSMVKGPNDSVIGVWASASRRSETVLSATPPFKSSEGGWVQVSRLGNPLVNEVVIGLGQKDLFNASRPANDSQFLPRFQNPLLATYFNVLFGQGVDTSNRQDLVDILLRGVKTLNRPAAWSANADELRYNMNVPTFGFPNGRNLTENVVDTELNAFDGAFCGFGGVIPACHAGANAGQLHQGVSQDSDHATTQSVFPYVNDPNMP
jgi:hypothetical protein